MPETRELPATLSSTGGGRRDRYRLERMRLLGVLNAFVAPGRAT